MAKYFDNKRCLLIKTILFIWAFGLPRRKRLAMTDGGDIILWAWAFFGCFVSALLVMTELLFYK
jgi:hypothetical protein